MTILYTENKDDHGYSWEIPRRISDVIDMSPIEIFWSRGTLNIRQENEFGVDLVEMDVGAAYDLLAVITRALSVGPEK